MGYIEVFDDDYDDLAITIAQLFLQNRQAKNGKKQIFGCREDQGIFMKALHMSSCAKKTTKIEK